MPKVRLVGASPSTGAVGVAAVSLPVPERLTFCGLPLTLSEMLTEAVRLPLSKGVNVTLIVQREKAANDLPQVLVSEKSLAFVPVTVMLVMLKAALPVLFRVTVFAVLALFMGWLPKARLVGERPTPDVPVFKRLVAWGLPVALSVRVTAAARVPLAAGVKATLVVQLVRAATLTPQSLVCAKSLA